MKQFETLIRAKKDDHSNFRWIEGRLLNSNQGPMIQEGNESLFHSIVNKTICVWINHNDKNGKKIFTNDFYRNEEDEPVICVFIKETSCFAFLNICEYLVYKHDGFDNLNDHGVPFNINDFDCEKISICGNIIDKELEILVSEDEKRYKKGSI